MRILVTGAAGFIGSTLVDALLASGHEVIGVDCLLGNYPRTLKLANLAGAMERSTFTFERRRVSRPTVGRLLDGVDACAHLAGLPGLSPEHTPQAYRCHNVDSTRAVVAACRLAGVRRVVIASSSSVYGSVAASAEDSPTHPISAYGWSKLEAERAAAAEAQGLELVILRYFSVYGPRQRPDMALHRFALALLQDRPLAVFGSGGQTRSLTYATDVVAATIQALVLPGATGVFNIGGDAVESLTEVIRKMATVIGTTPRINWMPPRPGDQTQTRAITDAARMALAWRPEVALDTGLIEHIAWVEAGLRSGAFRTPAPSSCLGRA